MILFHPRKVTRIRGRAFLEVGGAGATLLLEVVVPSLVTAVPDAATGCSRSFAFKPLCFLPRMSRIRFEARSLELVVRIHGLSAHAQSRQSARSSTVLCVRSSLLHPREKRNSPIRSALHI